MVHNWDRAEIFQNILIERTPKAAFQILNLSQNPSRPSLSVLKTDQEVLNPREAILGVIFKIVPIVHLLLVLVSHVYSPREVGINPKNMWHVLKIFPSRSVWC